MQSYFINNFQIDQTYIQSLVQVFTLPNFKDDMVYKRVKCTECLTYIPAFKICSK